MASSSAIQYQVINKAETSVGSLRFTDEIGVELSRQTLAIATDFTWKLLELHDMTQRKNVTEISLIIEDIDGVAYTEENEIHISTNYMEKFSKDLRSEVFGILYHETVHVWQWDGQGTTPEGLIEGIADFVRLKADYAPNQWPKAGEGEKWDQGYGVTARFLDFCNGIRGGFVAELNQKMKSGFNVDYFVELLGKPEDLLWSEYKAFYAR
ncbi:Plant basic secretory protein (BSP) family protein [Euphorbia peplus]|nr:Plant basic secretory protein (BSP) family protein [Euphorbia peplus]